MPTYRTTGADRAPLPTRYRTEQRHLGYDDTERTRPYATYLRPVGEVQEHVRHALAAGAAPTRHARELTDTARRLSQPGYDGLETGWAHGDHGTLVVHCLTDMPGVTAPMWDWWFGWHSSDSARYKLWHPDAHQFAALGDDRSADRSLSDRERYRHNVSYVDEFIGTRLTRLAIRFVDPADLGFDDGAADTTHVCAHLGPSQVPVGAGWLVHQIRPTPDGSEMRSRFVIGHGSVLRLPARSTSMPAVARALTSRVGRAALRPVVSAAARHAASDRLGRDLLEHCATEMNHLAGFLPDLYAEFRGTP